MTIYEVWGCRLFSSKAQPGEFGGEERLHCRATMANGWSSFSFTDFWKPKRENSFKTFRYLRLYGWHRWDGKNPNNFRGTSNKACIVIFCHLVSGLPRCLDSPHMFWLLLGLEGTKMTPVHIPLPLGPWSTSNGSVPPLPTQASSPCLARSLGSSNEFFKRVSKKKKKKRSLVAGMKVRMMGLPTWETKWEVGVSQGAQYWGEDAISQLLAIEHPLLSSQGLLEYGLKFRYSIFFSIFVQRQLDWRGDQNYC